MRIIITEFMDESAVARLQARHDVLYDATLVDDPARLVTQAPTADAIIVRNRTQVRDDLLAALARCQVVGRLGVGLDNIDVTACEARGIKVIPATGANASSVAEYVIASAMLLLRGAYRSSDEVAGGNWPRAALGNGREINGRTLGLVGFGFIGQCTGRLARALGMQVIAHDPMLADTDPVFAGNETESVSLDELLARSDVVSLHVPLLESTRKLFDAQHLGRMKRDAILVNSARGGVVDEPALAEALRNQRLGGAAIDVFEHEPVPADTVFAGCPNLLLTPHIAGVSHDSNVRVSALIAQRVLEELA